MSLQAIKPKIFDGTDHIKAFFTLKNRDFQQEGAEIEGLNLGFNTKEAPEIVMENRRRLIEAFDLDVQWIAFANQVHSNRVKVIADGGTFAETDSLITQVPGLALAIQVADCTAILLADPQSRTIAAIHAGWRGAAGDIVPRTINKMKELGVNPSDCKAFISPCISSQNFEVGREVAEQFPNQFVDYENYAKPHIDFKHFILWQLVQAELKEEHIETHQGCTVEEEKFYSYRREQEKSGRMMGIIQLTEGAT